MATDAQKWAVGNDITLWIQTEDGTAAALDIGAGAAGVRYLEDALGGTTPRVGHVGGTGNNIPLSVNVVGDDITVTLGTGATGVVNSTAAEVVALINAHAAASALVTASAVGDGTGTAVAAAIAALTGGTGPAFAQMSGQRDLSRSSSREQIDLSHKGSDHNQSKPGRQESSISVTILVLRPDAADLTHAALEDAFNDKLPVYVRQVDTFAGAVADGSANSVKEAEGYVYDFSQEAGDNSEATFDVEINLNEALRAVAA